MPIALAVVAMLMMYSSAKSTVILFSEVCAHPDLRWLLRPRHKRPRRRTAVEQRMNPRRRTSSTGSSSASDRHPQEGACRHFAHIAGLGGQVLGADLNRSELCGQRQKAVMRCWAQSKRSIREGHQKRLVVSRWRAAGP
jgi:hypothetical protein